MTMQEGSFFPLGTELSRRLSGKGRSGTTLSESLQFGENVVLVSETGGLFRAKKGGGEESIWSFVADTGAFQGSSFPAEAVLIVLKAQDPRLVGLSSAQADGKLLQATNEPGLQLQFGSHYLGLAEQWSISGRSFHKCLLTNMKFPDKKLHVMVQRILPPLEKDLLEDLTDLPDFVDLELLPSNGPQTASSEWEAGEGGTEKGVGKAASNGTRENGSQEAATLRMRQEYAKAAKKLQARVRALEDQLTQSEAARQGAEAANQKLTARLETLNRQVSDGLARAEAAELVALEARRAAEDAARDAEARVTAVEAATAAAVREEMERRMGEVAAAERRKAKEEAAVEKEEGIRTAIEAAESRYAKLAEKEISRARKELEARLNKEAEARVAAEKSKIELASAKSVEKRTAALRAEVSAASGKAVQDRVAAARAEIEARAAKAAEERVQAVRAEVEAGAKMVTEERVAMVRREAAEKVEEVRREEARKTEEKVAKARREAEAVGAKRVAEKLNRLEALAKGLETKLAEGKEESQNSTRRASEVDWQLRVVQEQLAVANARAEELAMTLRSVEIERGSWEGRAREQEEALRGKVKAMEARLAEARQSAEREKEAQGKEVAQLREEVRRREERMKKMVEGLRRLEEAENGRRVWEQKSVHSEARIGELERRVAEGEARLAEGEAKAREEREAARKLLEEALSKASEAESKLIKAEVTAAAAEAMYAERREGSTGHQNGTSFGVNTKVGVGVNGSEQPPGQADEGTLENGTKWAGSRRERSVGVEEGRAESEEEEEDETRLDETNEEEVESPEHANFEVETKSSEESFRSAEEASSEAEAKLAEVEREVDAANARVAQAEEEKATARFLLQRFELLAIELERQRARLALREGAWRDHAQLAARDGRQLQAQVCALQEQLQVQVRERFGTGSEGGSGMGSELVEKGLEGKREELERRRGNGEEGRQEGREQGGGSAGNGVGEAGGGRSGLDGVARFREVVSGEGLSEGDRGKRAVAGVALETASESTWGSEREGVLEVGQGDRGMGRAGMCDDGDAGIGVVCRGRDMGRNPRSNEEFAVITNDDVEGRRRPSTAAVTHITGGGGNAKIGERDEPVQDESILSLEADEKASEAADQSQSQEVGARPSHEVRSLVKIVHGPKEGLPSVGPIIDPSDPDKPRTHSSLGPIIDPSDLGKPRTHSSLGPIIDPSDLGKPRTHSSLGPIIDPSDPGKPRTHSSLGPIIDPSDPGKPRTHSSLGPIIDPSGPSKPRTHFSLGPISDSRTPLNYSSLGPSRHDASSTTAHLSIIRYRKPHTEKNNLEMTTKVATSMFGDQDWGSEVFDERSLMNGLGEQGTLIRHCGRNGSEGEMDAVSVASEMKVEAESEPSLRTTIYFGTIIGLAFLIILYRLDILGGTS